VIAKRIFAGILCFCSLAVQSQEKKNFKVNPGEKLIYALPRSEVYDYPDFIQGTVNFRNGRFASALMNFNVLYGEIQFIDPRGDTLSMDDEATVRNVIIQKDTFYFDKVFVRQIARYGDFTLAGKDFFYLVNRQKLGGFGETTNASVDVYDQMSTKNYFKDLIVREILTLGKDSLFFIGDRFNRFKPATKKNILTVYGKRDKEVLAYLKDNPVNFNSESDLRKMFEFLERK
jgi:hypothetical protein